MMLLTESCALAIHSHTNKKRSPATWTPLCEPVHTAMMIALWLLFSLALMAGGVSSMSNCSYHRLLDHLGLSQKSESLSNVRPVWNWTTPTPVMVDTYLYGILDVNEKSQTFTSHVMISMGWENELISWEPNDWCGIESVAVPRDMLWIPDVMILEDISDTGSITLSPYTEVAHSGMAYVTESRRLTTTCKMNLFKFPFDTQNCSITFISFMLKGIKLGPFSNSIIMSQFSEKVMVTLGEWDFLGIRLSMEKLIYDNNIVWDKLVYKISIRRRPLLYVINLLLPLLFFLILDLASFFIDEAKGEKLGYKVTILLSISVLLLILNDILPSTADDLPLIALYCIVIFALTGLSLLETMLVSFLIDMDSRVDHNIQTSSKTCEETPEETDCQRESQRDAEISLVKVEDIPNKDLNGDWLSNPCLLQRILEVRNIRQKCFFASVRCDKKKPGYWERVGRQIDQAYFCLYLITTIGFLVFTYHQWLH
ncbi:5-hydroxytryptamine receptor 3A-like [Oncorhynchus clarkii lewisi]|uniref:5-hydroxytryptamine receptor 3A-like n=1 Tax=Oncorhynchus clarkii lewisi TaxID=490388 RepID=UPI0039B86B27